MSVHTHTWMYPAPDTYVCEHFYNTLCQGSQGLCTMELGAMQTWGAVCECVWGSSRTQALKQPILQLWISPCTPRSFGVLWKEWDLLSEPPEDPRLSPPTLHWILTVPAACIDPHQCMCRDHLSPSFNKPCECHPGLGHVTVPCP